ncbi:hypothetical protein [Aquamicrobium terrae]|uniref:Uncharacterized protein n=1 Tax=Aquamicrobium terrae TaxID=1324945 RepID=A0ABV2N1D1_9HYPH
MTRSDKGEGVSPRNADKPFRPDVELYDPWSRHFASDHHRNEFRKALEAGEDE